ncbi:nuclease [Methanocaldococcus villosus KIN24-T80]|uniref:Nuclease n=1 Tax=Methanocaldococcus villosus KIN24-T80 TaxID=1069083 RepID=N6VYW6_9EURY|nr:thermonuclease family protein [Methanocaldococcus villosus]ENN96322.1 nuclease [Methanocaldococcus villosus KIN24-T80]
MRILTIFLILFLTLSGCITYNEYSCYYGRVVKVVDGDTVYVLVNGELWKIRLLGVDTPEISKENNPYEYILYNGTPITNLTYLKFWGERAKEFAYKKLYGKEVKIVFDPLAPRKDRYGRYLAYIYYKKGDKWVNFNEELIKYGYARVYRTRFKMLHEFLMLEEEAKKNRVGLWKGQLMP